MTEKDSVTRPLEGLKPDDGSLAPAEDITGGQTGPAIRTSGLSAEDNRGRRAPQSGSGVVIGSGASAGGGGGEEDFGSDTAAGSGPAQTSVSAPAQPTATPDGKRAEDWQPEDTNPE